MEFTSTPTIESGFIQRLLANAADMIDIESAIAESEIDRELLQTPGVDLPVDQVAKLVRKCKLEIDGVYARREGHIAPSAYFRLAALSAVHLRTLDQALARLIEFINLFQSGLEFELQYTASETELVASPTQSGHRLDCSIVDMYIGSLYRFIGWLGGQFSSPKKMKRTFSEPDYSNEYRAYYHGVPVLFNQDKNSIVFSAEYLQQPIIQNEHSVENYMRRAPLDTFLPLSLYGEFTGKLRRLIQAQLAEHCQVLTTEQAAAELQCSPHTLRRRLQAEGSNYHDIKLQIRRDIAIHHLSHDDFTIERIAEKVGYSEASGFVRAFKEWTGLSPLQFRKGLL